MTKASRTIATLLAASLAASTVASAWAMPVNTLPPPAPRGSTVNGGGTGAGGAVVGCVMGSALGLILSALVKKGELTPQEAALVAFTCGIGMLFVLGPDAPR